MRPLSYTFLVIRMSKNLDIITTKHLARPLQSKNLLELLVPQRMFPCETDDLPSVFPISRNIFYLIKKKVITEDEGERRLPQSMHLLSPISLLSLLIFQLFLIIYPDFSTLFFINYLRYNLVFAPFFENPLNIPLNKKHFCHR